MYLQELHAGDRKTQKNCHHSYIASARSSYQHTGCKPYTSLLLCTESKISKFQLSWLLFSDRSFESLYCPKYGSTGFTLTGCFVREILILLMAAHRRSVPFNRVYLTNGTTYRDDLWQIHSGHQKLSNELSMKAN